MSLSEILVPNVYDLYANSLQLATPFINKAIGFHYSLSNPIAIGFGYNTSTPLSGLSALTNHGYISPSMNTVTGIFTIPLSGLWTLTAGIVFPAIIAPDITNPIVLRIGHPGDILTPTILSEQIATAGTLQNWALTCSVQLNCLAGEQFQVSISQGCANPSLLTTSSDACFFSGAYFGVGPTSPF